MNYPTDDQFEEARTRRGPPSRKNPDNKPLRIVHKNDYGHGQEYQIVLSNLAIAEALLVQAGKDSAMPHFIAIVKELERIYGFEFVQVEDTTPKP